MSHRYYFILSMRHFSPNWRVAQLLLSLTKFRQLIRLRDIRSRQFVIFLQIDKLHSCCKLVKMTKFREWRFDEIQDLVNASVFCKLASYTFTTNSTDGSNRATCQFAEKWRIDEIWYLVKMSIFWILSFWRDSSICKIFSHLAFHVLRNDSDEPRPAVTYIKKPIINW